jgi:hypothetical protein
MTESTSNEGRTRFITNHRLLIFCLFSLALIGTTYYYLDDRKEIYEVQWLLASIIWYIVIGFSIISVFSKMRLGYLVAGILSWTTFAVWMLDNFYVVFQISVIATKPNLVMTIRNFIGVGIATLSILSSHNAFHKIHQVQDKRKFT